MISDRHSYLSRNCFELLVKSITAFVTLLASRFLDWVQLARRCTQSRSRLHTITIENAGFELALVQWLVLRHELPDQHVLDHRIIASYGLIAPLVTMSCRLLLRRVASRGVLPRERFSPLALFGHAGAVRRRLLLGVERTCRSSWPTSEFDPTRTSAASHVAVASPVLAPIKASV